MKLKISEGKLIGIKLYDDESSVFIGDDVTSIASNVFFNHDMIRKIILSDSIKSMEPHAFSKCTNLRKIKLPNYISELPNYLFLDCYSLEEIEIPFFVEKIGAGIFYNCTNLKKVVFPKAVKSINYYIFHNCNKLKEIKFYNYFNLKENGIEGMVKNFKDVYIDKNSNELVLLNDISLVKESYTKIDYYKNIEKYNCSASIAILITLFISEDKNEMSKIQYLIPIIFENYLNLDNFEEVISNLDNYKEFNRLVKRVDAINDEVFLKDLFKLSYSLGIFSNDCIERQKACEFLTNAFYDNKLSINGFHSIFDSMKFNGFNKEWAEFFMNKNNFNDLLDLENINDYFISKVYNSFNRIKEFNRSNKGDQKYRKITVDACKKYLLNSASFKGVDEDSIDIANELLKYTIEQETFDLALSIRKRYLALRNRGEINDHILMEELSDEIEKEKESIANDTKVILNNLNEVFIKKFSYEFLSKYDCKNFTLGKYCSCCAHLEGSGLGIACESILNPNCQNLVIKCNGHIIAKSTLYINKEQGYGLFNNIEVYKFINEEEKEYIYKKYIEAINKFVYKYNNMYPSSPIKKINVGMHLNDLQDIIVRNNGYSKELLKGIDFEGYIGDWQKDQSTLWGRGK